MSIEPTRSSVPPRDLEQQRKLAKELLKSAREGDPEALARIRAHRRDAREPILADAQLAVAREAGYRSWAELKTDLERWTVPAFVAAVRSGDLRDAREALRSPEIRSRVNDPLFPFGGRAINAAANDPAMLELLIANGADLDLKSDWAPGPFSVLDGAGEDAARFLLARGVRLTAHAAARLGWIEELDRLIAERPERVHERGGDGQQPLHVAKTVAIADLLLDAGADPDARCVDHRSTPAQYALVERTDVCRRLLERGATPDIFMAAFLGDLPLATSLIEADPRVVEARINLPGYPPVAARAPIYCWTLGFYLSPHEVARRHGHAAVAELLVERSPARVRFLDAGLTADEARARRILEEEPDLPGSLTRDDHALLTHTIYRCRFDAARVMLRLGFDPSLPGHDGGNALHVACAVGSVGMVDALLRDGRVSVRDRDAHHGATPLGWAVYASMHWKVKGPGYQADYAGVIDRLAAAGAEFRGILADDAEEVERLEVEDPAVLAAIRRHAG